VVNVSVSSQTISHPYDAAYAQAALKFGIVQSLISVPLRSSRVSVPPKRAEAEYVCLHVLGHAVAAGHQNVGILRKRSPLMRVTSVASNARQQRSPYIMWNSSWVAI
jgi:hypothetical protein